MYFSYQVSLMYLVYMSIQYIQYVMHIPRNSGSLFSWKATPRRRGGAPKEEVVGLVFVFLPSASSTEYLYPAGYFASTVSHREGLACFISPCEEKTSCY